MSDEPKWYERIDAAADAVSNVADDIAYLTGAWRVVHGRDDVNLVRFGEWMTFLRQAVSEVRAAMGQQCDEQMRQTHEATQNVFRACLAGLTVGRPDMVDTVKLMLGDEA